MQIISAEFNCYTMKRMLIIPAAGRGLRLGVDKPKFLYTIAGKTMISHVLAIYRKVVDNVAIVVSPEAHNLALIGLTNEQQKIEIAVQQKPTGMLDAILEARHAVYRQKPDRIWITWCDQVGILPETVGRILAVEAEDDTAMIVPVIRKHSPYIHFEKNRQGQIVKVLQAREKDTMPDMGENDMGLFSLSFAAFQELHTNYAKTIETGANTGERNFLPFIPWLSRHTKVVTVPGTDINETIGVNTPEDSIHLESWLNNKRRLY